MKQNVVQAASGRPGGADRAKRAIIPFIMTLLAPGLAVAGDRALIDYIGFSPDFRYFAFEEFGIQDGSGFAYSNLYVVDLESDSWVVGTPIRVQAEAEENSLTDIRAMALAEAESHITGFNIDIAVEILALIGDGAPEQDGKILTFGAPGYEPGAVIGDYEVRLSTFTTAAASPCTEWFDMEPQGYQLEISDGDSDRLAHRDDSLPRSRGCPVDYRLYGVVMPFGGTVPANAVAIVSVYPRGFEGPDRRFLAVPLGL